MILPDGRAVLGVQRGETTALWGEITTDLAYRSAATGLDLDEVILDVGAHVGLASLCFAGDAPGCRIVAFEPAPDTFRCLSENFGRHLPSAAAVRAAVGAEPGRAQLSYRRYLPSMSSLHADDEDDARTMRAFLDGNDVDKETRELTLRLLAEPVRMVLVEVTTVPAAMATYGIERIGLLKVDVERAEADVVRGIDAATWPRIRRVLIEVHDLRGRLAELTGRLRTEGFAVEVSQPAEITGSSVHSVLATRD